MIENHTTQHLIYVAIFINAICASTSWHALAIDKDSIWWAKASFSHIIICASNTFIEIVAGVVTVRSACFIHSIRWASKCYNMKISI